MIFSIKYYVSSKYYTHLQDTYSSFNIASDSWEHLPSNRN